MQGFHNLSVLYWVVAVVVACRSRMFNEMPALISTQHLGTPTMKIWMRFHKIYAVGKKKDLIYISEHLKTKKSGRQSEYSADCILIVYQSIINNK